MESEKESEKEQLVESQEAQEEEEEEEQALILKTTKVVEYLEPFMSLELLCKFPDNSAYDFDYSQSTIWSPLVPRPYSTPMDLDLITPRKLSYDIGLGARCSVNKLKKKFTSTAFNLKLDLIKKRKNKNKKMASDFSPTPPTIKGACNPIINKKRKNKNKKMASDFSPTPPTIKGACNPIINKRWGRALKAASKQFKKWKVKKRDPIAHVMLPKSFNDGDF